jgi:hypothetical protein
MANFHPIFYIFYFPRICIDPLDKLSHSWILGTYNCEWLFGKLGSHNIIRKLIVMHSWRPIKSILIISKFKKNNNIKIELLL